MILRSHILLITLLISLQTALMEAPLSAIEPPNSAPSFPLKAPFFLETPGHLLTTITYPLVPRPAHPIPVTFQFDPNPKAETLLARAPETCIVIGYILPTQTSTRLAIHLDSMTCEDTPPRLDSIRITGWIADRDNLSGLVTTKLTGPLDEQVQGVAQHTALTHGVWLTAPAGLPVSLIITGMDNPRTQSIQTSITTTR